MPVPEDTVDLGELDHPLLAEARRLAPNAPQGQKRIEAIAPPPLVFRLRHGQWRGAAWVDQEAQPTQIFWLVGAALRKAGDRDDAFEHFSRLHVAGTLLPNSDDKVRLRLEAAARTLDRCTADLGKLLEVADRSPQVEHAGVLGDCVSATTYKRVCDGYDEYWLALKVQVSGGGPTVPSSLREVLFASAQEMVGAEQADAVYAWPTDRTLSGHEIARLYVRGQ
jgi:hypothetical protein